ncbi:MAG TPA: NAD-dependent epimerase/dehydratase family protein [Verrucomicrobiae bacterium]|nr:NAD-dependent epimerase/dehydratase family protein [Verrucomicrobiae bacterium]
MPGRLTLVTGAPGWLGTRLVRVLAHGLPDVPTLVEPDPDRRIRCLVMPGAPGPELTGIAPTVELVSGDIRDPAAIRELCRGAEGATVFHLCGIIHPRRVRDLYAINVEGTRNVLAAAMEAGARRVVAVSSNSPAGANPHPDHRFDEASPYRPYRHYGESKRCMEALVAEAEATGRVETVVLRPCWFYGPEQPPRQSRFFTMIREGKAPLVGGGTARRSMSYIDNTCQALLLAERSAAARGRLYWVADRRPYTMNEIIDTVEQLLEREFGMTVAHRRLRLPALASQVAGVTDALLQAMGRYQQEVHVLSEMNQTIACSIGRAERELGYDPRIELEEGMRRSIRWCLEHGQTI